MVVVAPRSAKLIEARGSRFTLLCGYVFLFLAFLWMLLVWDEGAPYWQIAAAYIFVGAGVGLAGTPASHSLTGSVPVTRAGMASGTADLQRDLGGAIMQSIFGALLTAGYASAVATQIAASDQQVTDSTQAPAHEVVRRRRGRRCAAPAVRGRDHRGCAGGVPRGRRLGVHGRRRRDPARRRFSSTSCSRGTRRSSACSPRTTRKTRVPAAPGAHSVRILSSRQEALHDERPRPYEASDPGPHARAVDRARREGSRSDISSDRAAAASEGAPNVLIVLLDDVGFAASSAFGGPCHDADGRAPRGERAQVQPLPHDGALLPDPQALLTGRNHHSVGMGGHHRDSRPRHPATAPMRPNTLRAARRDPEV